MPRHTLQQESCQQENLEDLLRLQEKALSPEVSEDDLPQRRKSKAQPDEARSSVRRRKGTKL